MSKERENRYKMCRNTAGLTQERASELLHISQRTLSDYENGHARVPEDILALMVRIYNDLELLWWHLKHQTAYGEFLPDVVVPQNDGDAGFKAIMAQDYLALGVAEIKQLVGSGEMCEVKKTAFGATIANLQAVKAKLIALTIYGSKLKNKA